MMNQTDCADICASFVRVKRVIEGLRSTRYINRENELNYLLDLKAALMQDGPKNGLDNIEELVKEVKRKDLMTERHFLNLRKDLETLGKAEF